ncbi:DUF3040 domain-containing protein [Arthrobacter crystallopoietes]|jgi:hypothetical protein|uniref:DUF3040 domain-containing protein n=1 Tax=Crystallibacter crystallopoietes TaxID=37928 RepID=UPI0011110796|nr:DUF3040 domain-containing protein [Arthrobacter crystallopoietes]QTG81275.1 DUF3040 domain-containing protein [Arthrobacter crystallopoietes]
MPLSDEEREQLHALELQLAAEDPELAQIMRSDLLGPDHGQLVLAVLAWIIGLVLLIIGVATQLTVVGVGGFLVMGAAGYWAMRLYRWGSGIDDHVATDKGTHGVR